MGLLPAVALLAPAGAAAKCPPGVEAPDYCTIGYKAVVKQDIPLAYWRLGDALDTSVMSDEMGNYPGTYKNGAGGSPQLGISGDGNTVAYFVGNGQYGYVNGIDAPKTAYSMEAWVLAADGDASMIMQHGGSGALYITAGGRYAFVPDSNEVHLKIVDEEPGDVIPSGGASAFHHVVGTWDGSVGRLYVDGRKVGKATSLKPPSGSATFYIGYGTLAPWVRGYIDEAAYYDHALSAARISAHYYADPPPPLLVPRGLNVKSTDNPPASGQSSKGSGNQGNGVQPHSRQRGRCRGRKAPARHRPRQRGHGRRGHRRPHCRRQRH